MKCILEGFIISFDILFYMKLVDVHLHMEDILKFDEGIVKRAKEAGVVRMITAGCDRNKFKLSLGFMSDMLKVSLGLYPSHAYDGCDVDEAFEFIRANKDKIVAVGECGLDFFITKDSDERKAQKTLFVRHIVLANELGLPLIVHSRDAASDALDILENNCASRVLLHYFEGNRGEIKRAIELGYFLTVSADIESNDKILLKAKLVPIDLLLSETDAPVFQPDDKEFNEPAYVKIAVRILASIKGLSFDECANELWKNYLRLFK